MMHSVVRVARAQMRRREDNHGYYDIIAAFRERTGIGAVLNTSFNLHGEAIVEPPDSAIDSFLRSEIDTLLFDDMAVSRCQTS